MGKKFKKLLAFVLTFAMLGSFFAVPFTASAEQAPLKFGEDGKFKIVIFSDVQDQYPVHQRVINIMRQAIERENPDLVVFTGDMTEINTKDPEVDYRKTVEQILGPVVEAGVPYSIVFGNHDPQSGAEGVPVADKEALLRVWQSIGDCRTIDSVPELTGTGTCKVPIYSSNGNDLAFNLWMVDSNSYQNPLDGGSGYDNPHADQLAWMAANNDAGVNSIVFQHIPMPETYNLFVEDANGSKEYGGKKYKLELKEGVVGTAGEFPATIYADDNTGEFQTLKEMGNVLGVVSGHDHLNDFTGYHDGIQITAVPGMTYFNYGDEAIRGYGVIELDENDLSDYDYHSVKFSTLDAELGTAPETVYDAYDEITYADLKENGNKLGDSYTISGGHTFTYDATSPSKSAILKYRWTAGSKPGYQFSFDVGDNGNISHPFGVWIKRADQVAPNGSWHLKPNKSDLEVKMATAVKQGDTFDIEFGRLKVLEGDPKIVGQYYVYLKVNGKLIQEGYSNTAEDGGYSSGNRYDCMVSNEIRFGGWGNGGDDVISEYVEPAEQYEAYDVIGYEDLLDTGNNPLTPGGIQLTKTNNSVSYFESTEAAKTHSVIFKLRWTMETLAKFEIHMQGWGSKNNFAYFLQDNHWQHKADGAASPVALNPKPTSGDYYDLEVARLKVASGKNKGKYYTYFKVDGEIIFEKYVAADDVNTANYLGNKIFLGFADNNTCKISATPYDPDPDSRYYAYDEVTYYDMYANGSALPTDSYTVGSKTYTYNKTSETGSAIVKFRLKEYKENTNFYLGFDTEDKFAYRFGVMLTPPNTDYPNGKIWLSTGYRAQVGLKAPLEVGKDYDLELGRLKVKNGENKGDYYLYFKINDELIDECYIDGSLVSKQGVYTSNSDPKSDTPFTMTNRVYFSSWGGGTQTIAPSPYVEEYDAYDEVTYEDFRIDDNSLPANGIDLSANRKITYKATSPSYSAKVKFRWTAGTVASLVVYYDAWPNHPYGFAAKPPLTDVGGGKVAGENGAWHLDCSNNSSIEQLDKPIENGEIFDIEFTRLLVKNGKNKGKYYVSLTVNGELIKAHYTDALTNPAPTNIIRMVNGTADGIISSIPVEEPEVPEEPEEPESPYYEYDEIGYDDLTDANGGALGSEKVFAGGTTLKYKSTSDTGSVVFKYRWTIGSVPKFQMSFEKASDSSMAYRFGAWLEAAGADAEYPNGSLWVGPAYGPKIEMPYVLEAGSTHDMEFARLKVKTGENAGKYYVYMKIDGELISEYYVNADVVDANGNYITGPGDVNCNVKSGEIFFAFWGSEGNKISAVPFVEEYEAYDEIGFEDLKDSNGNTLGTSKNMVGGTTLKYDRTSPTGSVIFKYNWEVGSVAKFQMSFEKTADDAMGYMFGAWLSAPGEAANYPNGRMWLRPAYGPEVDMPYVLVSGQSYNVEFARLKVANGPNKGKYYVYIKIDDVIIAEDYVDASLVDADGNYVTKPGDVSCNVKSGEIFFAYWGSEGNEISAYKEKKPVIVPEGTKGDFDGDGVINGLDLVYLKRILLGVEELSELPEGIADFNNDGETDILDLIAIQKYLAPVNSYAKTGKLTLGLQEHLLEDESKTAEYIADATATMGGTAYRLSEPIHNLYYVTATNGVAVREDNMATFKEMVAALKAKGINDILYVTNSFILPANYGDPTKCHNITVPDPNSDPDNYIAWLEVNAAAFKALAEEVPEIKFFEPFNEINTKGTRFEKYGVAWDSTSDEQANFKFTVKEKAAIMADLCWYISRAVKSVDSANQVTSPSIVVGSNVVIEKDFIEEFYKAIESGTHPINNVVADTRVDNYFTIVNLHAYPDYTEDDSWLGDNFESNANKEINEWAGYINEAYNVVKAHNDGGSRVWLSEIGMSTYHSDGEPRSEENVAAIIEKALQKLDSELTFIDTVIFYQVADISLEKGASPSETYFGLFYAYDDLDHEPYAAKESAKAIYSYFHNGSTDYTAINEFVARYA
ncbi:MAG: metallophosphoesterase [Clostridia bacterium]|nr:metallophosphoesterase [Clostridia bacterium]